MSSRTTRAVVVAGAALLLTATLTAAPTSAKPGKAVNCNTQNSNTYAKLLNCVTVDGVLEHEQALQAIADANGGTRADQTPGYQASVDYVVETLEDAGWSAEVVPFTYNGTDSTLQQLTPIGAVYQHNVAVGSGEGDVTAAVVPVDINLVPPRANTSGCEAADFGVFPAGAIALVQRGGCGFVVKAQNAQDAGAGGVIIFNQGDTAAPDRNNAINPTLAPLQAVIPVVGVSFADGAALAQAGSTAQLKVDFVTRESFNVIGELAGTNTSNIVMAGAHLDSVPAGPGHQRQRQWLLGPARRGPGTGQPQAAEHRAVRLVGRRGARTDRLHPVGRAAHPGRARRDRSLHELRHDRVAELLLRRV